MKLMLMTAKRYKVLTKTLSEQEFRSYATYENMIDHTMFLSGTKTQHKDTDNFLVTVGYNHKQST
jgi:hypothetical protein